MAGNTSAPVKGLLPPTMYSVAALKDLMSNKRQITLNRVSSSTFTPHETLEKLARSSVMYKRQRYNSSAETTTQSELLPTGAASSTSNVPAPFEQPVPKGKRGARPDTSSQHTEGVGNGDGEEQVICYRGVVRLADGTYAVQPADKAVPQPAGHPCAELAALEYDAQQRRLLGDAAACNFPPHITAEDVKRGRLQAVGLVPAAALSDYQAYVARHATPKKSRPVAGAAALEALANCAAAAEVQLESAAASGAAASAADAGTADVEGPASSARRPQTSAGATAAQKRAKTAAEKRKMKAVQEAASAADHGPRIKRHKERPPLVERPQAAPKPSATRRGLFATAALPIPAAVTARPSPPVAQEARVAAGSPALQSLLELQPSLDASTRAGVANVLRQWGVAPNATYALVPVPAAVPAQAAVPQQQQPVLDDLELFRQSLRTMLLLLGRVVGVHIDPADPNKAVPLSVLAKQTGQNEMSMLLPLLEQARCVLATVEHSLKPPVAGPSLQAHVAPQVLQQLQTALQQPTTVSPMQAQVADTLSKMCAAGQLGQQLLGAP